MKNLLKLKNLYALIFITALAYGGYYFGTQNTVDSTSSKTLELTTISIQKGDLAKKEEYNGTLRQTDKKNPQLTNKWCCYISTQRRKRCKFW